MNNYVLEKSLQFLYFSSAQASLTSLLFSKNRGRSRIVEINIAKATTVAPTTVSRMSNRLIQPSRDKRTITATRDKIGKPKTTSIATISLRSRFCLFLLKPYHSIQNHSIHICASHHVPAKIHTYGACRDSRPSLVWHRIFCSSGSHLVPTSQTHLPVSFPSVEVRAWAEAVDVFFAEPAHYASPFSFIPSLFLTALAYMALSS